MIDYVYDIETFPNVFTMSVKQIGSPNRWQFEISRRCDDHGRISQWVASASGRMVGFNSLGFDYPVLHYVLTQQPSVEQIYLFAKAIIESDDRWGHIIWDRGQLIPQVDLFKIHHFDNVSRATSLKVLEFNMRMDRVEDLPFPPGTYLAEDWQIDTLLRYNNDDVDATERFYFKTLDAIRFREELSIKYNKNFLNHNDTKIGKDYFIMELERRLPGSCYDSNRQPRQTWRHQIALKDIIFPWIKFKRVEFQLVHQWLLSQTIRETKGVFSDISKDRLGPLADYCTLNKKQVAKNLHVIVDGFQFDFGTGGIHGSVSSRTVRSDDDHELVDIDVASFYPNLGIVNRIYPEHLGAAFCDIYQDVFEQRKTYPKGSPENQMLKLALNGVYGDSNNAYSPFYDPAYTMAITINGQLLLCLLADYLMDIPGLEMIQVNTDGVTVRIPRSRRADLAAVTDWWQAHTCLVLEEAVYSAMYIRDVNNYLAVYEGSGKVKRKGAYGWVVGQNKGLGELDWNQNHGGLIIPMAAEAALIEGESVRDFILNHDDIFDFMLRAKVPRSSRLVMAYGGVEDPLPNMCRYYISKTGGSLVKIMPPLPKAPDKERRIGIDVGWFATEANNIHTARGLEINYEYYISEAEKLVKPLLGS